MMNEQKSEKKTINALTEVQRIVPKFCTSIQIAVLENRNVVLTMLYAEEENAALIDRVIIDSTHAKNLIKVLTEALDENVSNRS